jgi:hypothetical protein
MNLPSIQPPRPSIAIAEIPVTLERDQQIFRCKLKSPGIVRALGVWLKEPSVLGSASMRAVEKIAMPMMFVECSPTGEMLDKTFLFVPSGAEFGAADGYRAEYRATSVSQVGAVHCFEIVGVL